MKNINKPICKNCINCIKQVCAGDCEPIKWINGTHARREPLVNDILSENLNSEKNYNEILSELAGDRKEKIALILEIADPRKKLIMLALLAGYHQHEIAGYLKLSTRQILRIVKK